MERWIPLAVGKNLAFDDKVAKQSASASTNTLMSPPASSTPRSMPPAPENRLITGTLATEHPPRIAAYPLHNKPQSTKPDPRLIRVEVERVHARRHGHHLLDWIAHTTDHDSVGSDRVGSNALRAPDYLFSS